MGRLDEFGFIIRLDEVSGAPFIREKLPIQGSEEPRLHFPRIAELVTFGRPRQEGLLRQIDGVRFLATQREAESIKWHIVLLDQLFELRIGHEQQLLSGPAGRE